MLGNRMPQQMMLSSPLRIPASLIPRREAGRGYTELTSLFCPFQGQHGCYQPIPRGCPASQAHPGYLGHSPHHPCYHCHHDLLVSLPGHCGHHLSNADSPSSQRGCLRLLKAGWRVMRAGVLLLACSQKNSGETQELDLCFGFDSAVGQWCRCDQGT